MFPVHFAVLTATGSWCPPNWTSNFLIFGYRLYTFLVYIVIIAVGTLQIAQLIRVMHDLDEFNNLFMISVSFNFGFFKGIFIVFTQKRILHLINMFNCECCIFQSSDEERIQKKYNDFCRIMALVLLAFVEMAVLVLFLAPLFNGNVENRDLVFKVRLPYNITKPQYFWLTYIHQFVGSAYAAANGTTMDILLAGFMLQICCQIDILKCRVKQLPVIISEANAKFESESERKIFESQLLSQLIQHHIHIFKLVEAVCLTFYEIVVSQFCVSAFAICVTVYQLSVTSNKFDTLSYFLYLMCMLQEIFLYCFFGNEASLQSISLQTTIFSIDWTGLSPTLVKDLSMIIARTNKPINMSCGPFVHLTLESFSKILKLSYSVFNFLKQSTSQTS